MSRFPVFNIDKNKCQTPYDCKICLQICPQAVFEAIPVKVVKFKETDPKEPHSYTLHATYRRKCSMCNKCIEMCPKQAISISI